MKLHRAALRVPGFLPVRRCPSGAPSPSASSLGSFWSHSSPSPVTRSLTSSLALFSFCTLTLVILESQETGLPHTARLSSLDKLLSVPPCAFHTVISRAPGTRRLRGPWRAGWPQRSGLPGQAVPLRFLFGVRASLAVSEECASRWCRSGAVHCLGLYSEGGRKTKFSLFFSSRNNYVALKVSKSHQLR